MLYIKKLIISELFRKLSLLPPNILKISQTAYTVRTYQSSHFSPSQHFLL